MSQYSGEIRTRVRREFAGWIAVDRRDGATVHVSRGDGQLPLCGRSGVWENYPIALLSDEPQWCPSCIEKL